MGDPIVTIGILGALGVGFYFLMIRPQRQQQKKQTDMMNALAPGDRVMLGSGIYGTIRHLGEKQAILEISPGVDLTIMRAAIRVVVTPDDEEFEYSSEPDTTEPDEMVDFEADMDMSFAPPYPGLDEEDEPAEPTEDADAATIDDDSTASGEAANDDDSNASDDPESDDKN